jgi:CHU_C Type IX secretion signal domain
MNINTIFNENRFSLSLVFILVLNINTSIAQTKSYGNLIVENSGEMKIYDTMHFRLLNINKALGVIGTERSDKKGYVSYMPGATWYNAHNLAFVDGYARSYQTNSFIFPIGDNSKFRPAKISSASLSNPTDAAYYGVNPTLAVTSPFFGNVNSVLPADGPYSTSQKESKISFISTKEYWDINGSTPAKISLSWDANSAISTLVSGKLENLTIAGWNGTQWVNINSQLDVTSIFGFASTMTIGSITTNTNIVPNTYSVYTLACLVPTQITVFSSKNIGYTVYQNQSSSLIHPFNSNYTDTNLVITISHPTPLYGKLTNQSPNGYKYNADNYFLGIDSVLSIAKIYHKPSAVYVYDTFISEFYVRYIKADTSIDMGTQTSAIIGKPFVRTQNIGYSYTFKSKYGTLSNFNNGLFQYQSNKYNLIDTLYYYFTADYKGALTTKDSTRYIIKLAKGTNTNITSLSNDEIKIQNFVSPNNDGVNDNWVLPTEITDKYSKINVTISTIDARIIYQNNQYKNEWPLNQDVIDGIYLYQIRLEDNKEFKGILRVENK